MFQNLLCDGTSLPAARSIYCSSLSLAHSPPTQTHTQTHSTCTIAECVHIYIYIYIIHIYIYYSCNQAFRHSDHAALLAAAAGGRARRDCAPTCKAKGQQSARFEGKARGNYSFGRFPLFSVVCCGGHFTGCVTSCRVVLFRVEPLLCLRMRPLNPFAHWPMVMCTSFCYETLDLPRPRSSFGRRFFDQAFLSCEVLGIDNGIGLTPPRGWRSWNAFDCLESLGWRALCKANVRQVPVCMLDFTLGCVSHFAVVFPKHANP